MLKLLQLGMVLYSKLSYLTTLLLSGTPVRSLMMPLSGGSAWTCCFGEDPEGRLGLLRHTGVAICASEAIKIRRLSSETRLKSDAEMTDHCGRHHRMGGRPADGESGKCGCLDMACGLCACLAKNAGTAGT